MKKLLASAAALVLGVCAATADPHDYYATVLAPEGTGSSFMLLPGVAATNAHVVAGQLPGDSVRVVAAGVETQAQVLAISSRMDLALLRVPRELLPVAQRKPARARRNEVLVAVGAGAIARGHVVNPRHVVEPFGPGFTAVLRGGRRGFSGGPVFDSNGHLAGMFSAVYRHRNSHAFLLGADDIRAESCRMVVSLCPHLGL